MSVPEGYQRPNEPRFSIEDEPPRRGRGCFFYGCLALVLAGIVGAVLVFLGLRALSGFLREKIEQYTADAPAELPPLNVPPDQRKQIIDRVAEFRRRVDTPAGPGGQGVLTDEERTIELTADEINVLLEDERDLAGRARVEINGDKLQGEISLPLGDLPMMRGRYLNGRATIIPRAVNGRLQVRLADVEVKGQRLPQEIQEVLDREDIVPDRPPEGAAAPPSRSLESVEVVNGKLRVVFAREPAGASPTEPGAAEPKTDELKATEPKTAEPEATDPEPAPEPQAVE